MSHKRPCVRLKGLKAELITSGFVTVDGKTVDKPAYNVMEENPPRVCVTGQIHPFVGRGGMKLDGALSGGGEEAAVAIIGSVVGNNEVSYIDLICHMRMLLPIIVIVK